MKTAPWLVLATLLCPLVPYGQVAVPWSSPEPKITEVGPHHRVWQTVKYYQDGQTVTNSYTELATGLSFFSGGKYLETREQFQVTPDGHAIATNGPHNLILASDINSGGSVDFLTPDGKRLISNPMGLSFRDATGKNVLIAEV